MLLGHLEQIHLLLLERRIISVRIGARIIYIAGSHASVGLVIHYFKLL